MAEKYFELVFLRLKTQKSLVSYKSVHIAELNWKLLTFAGIPPTKTRFGIRVPYFGVCDAAEGAVEADSGEVSPGEQLYTINNILA